MPPRGHQLGKQPQHNTTTDRTTQTTKTHETQNTDITTNTTMIIITRRKRYKTETHKHNRRRHTKPTHKQTHKNTEHTTTQNNKLRQKRTNNTQRKVELRRIAWPARNTMAPKRLPNGTTNWSKTSAILAPPFIILKTSQLHPPKGFSHNPSPLRD